MIGIKSESVDDDCNIFRIANHVMSYPLNYNAKKNNVGKTLSFIYRTFNQSENFTRSF